MSTPNNKKKKQQQSSSVPPSLPLSPPTKNAIVISTNITTTTTPNKSKKNNNNNQNKKNSPASLLPSSPTSATSPITVSTSSSSVVDDLFKACQSGDVEAVLEASQNGGGFPFLSGSRKRDYWSTFHEACQWKQTKVVQTILQEAIKFDEEKKKKKLFGDEEEGAAKSTSSVSEIINQITRNGGQTGLHVACAAGSLEIVKLLIEEYGDNIERTDGHKSAPLLIASREGHSDVVEYIIQRLSAKYNSKSNNNETPSKKSQSMRKSGSQQQTRPVVIVTPEFISAINAMNSDGATAFSTSASNGSLEIAKRLLENGADPSLGPVHPLIQACQSGRSEIVKTVIRHLQQQQHDKNNNKNNNLFNINDIKQRTGATCLIVAAQEGKTDITKFLIEEANADVFATTNDGYSCLHFATWANKPETAKIILDSFGPEDSDKKQRFLELRNKPAEEGGLTAVEIAKQKNVGTVYEMITGEKLVITASEDEQQKEEETKREEVKRERNNNKTKSSSPQQKQQQQLAELQSKLDSSIQENKTLQEKHQQHVQALETELSSLRSALYNLEEKNTKIEQEKLRESEAKHKKELSDLLEKQKKDLAKQHEQETAKSVAAAEKKEKEEAAKQMKLLQKQFEQSNASLDEIKKCLVAEKSAFEKEKSQMLQDFQKKMNQEETKRREIEKKQKEQEQELEEEKKKRIVEKENNNNNIDENDRIVTSSELAKVVAELNEQLSREKTTQTLLEQEIINLKNKISESNNSNTKRTSVPRLQRTNSNNNTFSENTNTSVRRGSLLSPSRNTNEHNHHQVVAVVASPPSSSSENNNNNEALERIKELEETTHRLRTQIKDLTEKFDKEKALRRQIETENDKAVQLATNEVEEKHALEIEKLKAQIKNLTETTNSTTSGFVIPSSGELIKASSTNNNNSSSFSTLVIVPVITLGLGIGIGKIFLSGRK